MAVRMPRAAVVDVAANAATRHGPDLTTRSDLETDGRLP